MINRRTKGTNEEIEVKPLRFYHEQYIDIADINEGDIVIAHLYALKNDKIMFRVSDIQATMELDDFSYEPERKRTKSAIAQIGKNLPVRVKSVTKNGLRLERKTIVEETTEILKKRMNEVVNATVECICGFGLFVDIGNGIVTLIPNKEVSKCRYNMSEMFSKGEFIKVKILGYDSEISNFCISRKQAYKREPLEEGMITEVTCSTTLDDGTGVFVEYNPATPGIMDIPEGTSFKDGERVSVVIKRIVDAGFKSNFIARR